jgi:hypothetical protein
MCKTRIVLFNLINELLAHRDALNQGILVSVIWNQAPKSKKLTIT